MKTEEDRKEALAAYALNVLDDDEREAVERHLEDCADCRDELSSLTDAAAAMGMAVEPVSPPPVLRTRIVDAARRGGDVIPLRRRLAPVMTASAAIAACAAIAFGIWAALLHSDLSNERDARSAQAAAVAVLSDPAARRVTLSGRDGILAVRTDGTAALAVTRLSHAPAGKTYEAWVIAGKTPQPAGLFDGGSAGATVVVLNRRVPHGAVVAVTVERATGVPAPTSKPILSGRV